MDSAIFISAGEGAQQRVAGSVHTNKILPADTGGAFAAIEITVPPGAGAPPHRHARDAECFYVLAGELTFEHEGGAVTGRAGDMCCLPAGATHAFRNDGEGAARVLVIIGPGGESLRFFGEVDALPAPPTLPEMRAMAARNGIELVG